MKHLFEHTTLFLIILSANFALAQHSDSLRGKAYLTRIENSFLSHPDTAVRYCKKLIELSKKANNPHLLSEAYGYLAYIHTEKLMIQEAIENWNKCLEIKRKQKDTLNISKVLNNLGYIHLNYGELEKSLPLFKESYRLASIVKDTNLISEQLVNIGSYYDTKKQTDSALYYYQKSLSLVENKKEEKLVHAVCYNNIGLSTIPEENYRKLAGITKNRSK